MVTEYFVEARNTIQQAIHEINHLRAENRKLREACLEALLFMTAPLNSPRLWPTSRGALTRKLEAVLCGSISQSEIDPQGD